MIATLLCASSANAGIDAAQQLADKYAPIVMMRAQENGPCDDSEEQYAPPTSVNAVLGNPAVRLLRRGPHGVEVIRRAPTATDIAGLGEDHYLDLPGNPLNPGCTYARSIAALRRAGRAPAVTYAHIAREPGHAGFTLQYWFYYYFNNFNDLHESDWEGMQLAFDETDPALALRSSPYEIVVFQHAGGEHADWGDAKVQKRGTHPVVYSAGGSHATFYDSSLYLGNGQNGSGVGCDDTTAPLTETRPRAVLVPDVPSARGAFAWLTFTGHWGQREAGFNNGPAGPNTKTVWRDPFTWMDHTRDSSPKLPAAPLIGSSISHAFCSAVADVSSFLNFKELSATGALVIAIVLVLILVVPPCLTRWRPAEPEPLRQARALGQLLLTSARLYGRHALALLLIALSMFLIIIVIDNIAYLVLHALAGGSGAAVVGSRTGLQLAASSQFGQTLVAPLGTAAVIAYVRRLEADQPATFGSAWKDVLRRTWRLLAVGWLTAILTGLMALTIIGIPFAIRKYVDWQLAQQEVLFEDRSIRDALRGSSRVVRGHWWHTALTILTFSVLTELPHLLGFALLFITVPTATVDFFGSVVFVLLLPYVAVGRTLLYLDLAARKAQAAEAGPAVSRRSRLRRILRRPRVAPPAPPDGARQAPG